MRRRFKYIVKLGAVLFLFPTLAQAACSSDGYTAVFINGVIDTQEQAKVDQAALQKILGNNINGQSLKVVLGYNATHLAGAGDLIETEFPKADDYDLATILMQMHDQVRTRKMLIIGHSQGAVYANKVYEYLVQHGEPAASVAVYAVATPDSYVAGGGRYITYDLDSTITVLPAMAGLHPLPGNVDSVDIENSAQVSASTIDGHSLIDTYLNFFPNRIVSDINTELWLLRSEPSTATDGCFDAPAPDPLYSMQKGALASGDVIAVGVKGGVEVAGAVAGTTGNMLAAVGGFVGSVATALTPSQSQSAKNSQALSDTVVALGNALNLTSLTPKVNDQLLNNAPLSDLGGAAILATSPQPVQSAPNPAPQPKPEGEVLGASIEAGTEQPAAPQAAGPLIPQSLGILAPIPGGGGGGGTNSAPPQNIPTTAANQDDTATTTASDTASTTDITDDTGSTTPPVIDTGDSTTTATSTDDTASSTPFVLLPPQNIMFSHWRSSGGCDATTREFDVSWDPVPGAVRYVVGYDDGMHTYALPPPPDDTQPIYPDLFLLFGINWSITNTVHVTAYDAGGNSAESSASANAAAHTTGPLVVSIEPTWGSTDVPISTPIKITYSDPVDPATVSGVAFSHIFVPAPASGGLWEQLGITTSLEGDGRTIDVTPDAPLLPGQEYSVASSCGVKDLYGNFVQDITSSVDNPQFTTATSS